jgi:hypothetical protein
MNLPYERRGPSLYKLNCCWLCFETESCTHTRTADDPISFLMVVGDNQFVPAQSSLLAEFPLQLSGRSRALVYY